MPSPQAHIQALIDDMVATGPEAGLQVAAWHKGKLIVDAWAGHDALTGKPVDGDTLFVILLTTTCVSPTAFGHTGAGGFTAYADPAHELAFALCKTRMVDDANPDTPAARRFERELHRALGL